MIRTHGNIKNLMQLKIKIQILPVLKWKKLMMEECKVKFILVYKRSFKIILVKSKKVIPHVLFCQIFRWPQTNCYKSEMNKIRPGLTNYHQLRSVMHCRYAYGRIITDSQMTGNLKMIRE